MCDWWCDFLRRIQLPKAILDIYATFNIAGKIVQQTFIFLKLNFMIANMTLSTVFLMHFFIFPATIYMRPLWHAEIYIHCFQVSEFM